MDHASETVCVILAGGRGKRMASKDRHKVCFPILGTPAIVRAVDVYKAAGLRRFLVVVGQMAEQVIATVTEAHPEVSFVFQPEPRGTGHAAAIATEALAAQNHQGNVMIAMGDKVTRPEVVRRLLEKFDHSGGDVVVTTLPKAKQSTAGRVVTDGRGDVLGIVEVPDLQDARRKRRKISLGGREFTPTQVERRSKGVNASMYVFRFRSLQAAVRKLQADNVQGELYLTDTVEHVGGHVETMMIDDPTELMAYNTPEELLAVEQTLRQRERAPRVSLVSRKRLPPSLYKPARQWIRALRGGSAKLRRTLRSLYGTDEAMHEERLRSMRDLVRRFAKLFGPDRAMVLCRAPGRINLMGRHVDHRGGYVNVMAINREVILAAGPRDDDVISLNNLDSKRFPPRQFRIGQLLRGFSWTDWMEFLGSRAAQSIIQSAPGDWSHYARAPLLRMQHECRGAHLRGMDCLVGGNIPMGAGLSSSSAVVVAFAEAAVVLNGLDVAMRDFIDLCGEGEWFVGSRGGSADHAAIRTSSAGCISRIGFFPFHQAGEVRFPDALRLVIAHSGSEAIKSAGARDIYNQRVACYEIAQMLLRRAWPPAAGIEHLRDLTPERLGVRPGEVYRALMRLPNRPSRQRLRKLIAPEDRGRLDELFATHANLGRYDLRGIALYGIAECVRSAQFAETIRRGELGRVGQLMRASHDGDRVVKYASNGRARKHVVRTDDVTLEKRAAGEEDLSLQSGRYACSTPFIDQLVDIADSIEGVVGSQLAGAGLGGCMMILVREESLRALLAQLRRRFYRPRGLRCDMHVCQPAAGAGLLRL